MKRKAEVKEKTQRWVLLLLLLLLPLRKQTPESRCPVQLKLDSELKLRGCVSGESLSTLRKTCICRRIEFLLFCRLHLHVFVEVHRLIVDVVLHEEVVHAGEKGHLRQGENVHELLHGVTVGALQHREATLYSWLAPCRTCRRT